MLLIFQLVLFCFCCLVALVTSHPVQNSDTKKRGYFYIPPVTTEFDDYYDKIYLDSLRNRGNSGDEGQEPRETTTERPVPPPSPPPPPRTTNKPGINPVLVVSATG